MAPADSLRDTTVWAAKLAGYGMRYRVWVVVAGYVLAYVLSSRASALVFA